MEITAVWKNRVYKLMELLDLSNGMLPKPTAYRCFLTGYKNQSTKQILFNATLKIAIEKGLIIDDKKVLLLTGKKYEDMVWNQ